MVVISICCLSYVVNNGQLCHGIWAAFHYSKLVKKNLNFIYFTTITHGYKLATRWSCWVEYETFSVRENHWNFFPGWKNLTYSCWLWDLGPWPPSHSMVLLTPRIAQCLNHLTTEDWSQQHGLFAGSLFGKLVPAHKLTTPTKICSCSKLSRQLGCQWKWLCLPIKAIRIEGGLATGGLSKAKLCPCSQWSYNTYCDGIGLYIHRQLIRSWKEQLLIVLLIFLN